MAQSQSPDQEFESITRQALSAAIAGPALSSAIHGVGDEVSSVDFCDLFCAAISLALIQGVKHLYGERVKELIEEQKLEFNRLDEQCRTALYGRLSLQFTDWTRRANVHANHVLDFGLVSVPVGYVIGEIIGGVWIKFTTS